MTVARAAGQPRIVVLIQENHTTDHYFSSLRPFGANVATDLPQAGPEAPYDPHHEHNAFVWWLMTKQGLAGRTPFRGLSQRIDTDSVLPYYSYLAKTGAFFEYHFAEYGTNSMAGHMVMLGGQTPLLTDPTFEGTSPAQDWNLPTILRLAERSGYSWGAFTDPTRFPVKHFRELNYDDAAPHIHSSDDFLGMARNGTLPDVCFVWNRTGKDEHPPLDVRAGEQRTQSFVDAVVKGGGWNDTVFMLTFDDWGGFDDHVTPPCSETVPDAIHPHGFQMGYGARVPLVMFGGHVRPGIDSRLCSQVSVPATIQELLGLPAIGVPRMDTAVDLADRYDPAVTIAPPPGPGARIVQPLPPWPAPQPAPLPALGRPPRPLDPLYLSDGTRLPAPTSDGVTTAPPAEPSVVQGLLQKAEARAVAIAPAWLVHLLGRPAKHYSGAAPKPVIGGGPRPGPPRDASAPALGTRTPGVGGPAATPPGAPEARRRQGFEGLG